MVRKRFHLGLVAAALVLLACGGVSFADGPIEVGPGGACCTAAGGCAVGGCATGCCKTCQSVQHIVKVKKRVYGEKCEDFCLCHPTLFGGLFNLQEALAKDRGCYQGNCCGCGSCAGPYTKKYLLIHIREHEECQQKCEIPSQECATGVIVAPGIVAVEPMTPKLNPYQRAIVVPPGK